MSIANNEEVANKNLVDERANYMKELISNYETLLDKLENGQGKNG